MDPRKRWRLISKQTSSFWSYHLQSTLFFSFFSGNKPGFVDYMIWPFFPKALTFATIFPELKFPTSAEFPVLVQWMELMKKDAAVKALKLEDHLVEYTKSVLEGNTNYDVGL